MLARFPRLYAAASLKRGAQPALRLGLPGGFPRLYAAASLKLGAFTPGRHVDEWFSAALCRGLIEASIHDTATSLTVRFSAALCRGLIEASPGARRPRP